MKTQRKGAEMQRTQRDILCLLFSHPLRSLHLRAFALDFMIL